MDTQTISWVILFILGILNIIWSERRITKSKVEFEMVIALQVMHIATLYSHLKEECKDETTFKNSMLSLTDKLKNESWLNMALKIYERDELRKR